MSLENITVEQAGLFTFLLGVLTFAGTFLNDKARRKKETNEEARAAQKDLLGDYSEFNERVQRREEVLLERITGLEQKISALHHEIFELNKIIAECIRSGHINDVLKKQPNQTE